MKNMSFKLVSLLLSVSALTVFTSTMSVRAETPTDNSSFGQSESSAVPLQAVEPAASPVVTADPLAVNSSASVERVESSVREVQSVESSVTPVATFDPFVIDSTSSFRGFESPAAPVKAVGSAETPVAAVDPLAIETTVTQTPKDLAGQRPVQQAQLADINKYQADSQVQSPEAIGNNQPTSTDAERVSATPPIPGTVETSASALTARPKTPAPSELSSDEADSTVAQTSIDPGRTTRGGSSYIGIGGNLGLGGGSALGDSSFAVISKIGLTRNFSFRPTALIGDETVFLLPVTYDFVIQSTDPFAPVSFAPYLGGGASITTSGDLAFLVSGGVDFPITREFVANAAINVNFGDDTNVGLLLGVGYTFPGFVR